MMGYIGYYNRYIKLHVIIIQLGYMIKVQNTIVYSFIFFIFN